MAEVNIPTGPIEQEPMRAIRVERPETLTGAGKEALYAALAGVELGAYDRRIVDWLAMYGDMSTVAVVCSWLYRVREVER
ncbi:hypothetical protein ACQP2T_63950 (plasmid) [Nonomuraea sp. CA-143628]|uniref:hypothetical protein n=1 Tax=Nonomuraea sp. CA-143628 TaxID=3239997 RepID=UPI003D8E0643